MQPSSSNSSPPVVVLAFAYKQVIKTVIGEKQQQIGRTRLMQRSGLFDEHSCYVLVGIHQAGKSYTLYQDMQARISAGTAKAEDFLYINFEDERLAYLIFSIPNLVSPLTEQQTIVKHYFTDVSRYHRYVGY